ncbi:MAG: hypothetical protein MUC87_10000 [Bacteroidia bacterium]|jgi:hypothetical protein|nr:hypothetical protein [Bacteroidia bacterium]
MKKCLLILLSLIGVSINADAQPVRSFGGAGGPELCWAMCHPKAGRIVFACAQRARAVTDSLQNAGTLADGNGGRLDAFRHAYWMALCVQQITPAKAEQAGRAHEKTNYKQFKRGRYEDGAQPDSMASVMDLFNNSTGIAIGLAYKSDQSPNRITLIQRILNAIKTGQLRILKKDTAGNFLTCEGKIISVEEYKGKWNVPKCMVNSNKIQG